MKICVYYVDKADLVLLISNRHEIRRLKTHDVSMDSLVSGLRNTIALDYYYNHSKRGGSSLLFWTDVFDDKIYRGSLIANCKLILLFICYISYEIWEL